MGSRRFAVAITAAVGALALLATAAAGGGGGKVDVGNCNQRANMSGTHRARSRTWEHALQARQPRTGLPWCACVHVVYWGEDRQWPCRALARLPAPPLSPPLAAAAVWKARHWRCGRCVVATADATPRLAGSCFHQQPVRQIEPGQRRGGEHGERREKERGGARPGGSRRRHWPCGGVGCVCLPGAGHAWEPGQCGMRAQRICGSAAPAGRRGRRGRRRRSSKQQWEQPTSNPATRTTQRNCHCGMSVRLPTPACALGTHLLAAAAAAAAPPPGEPSPAPGVSVDLRGRGMVGDEFVCDAECVNATCLLGVHVWRAGGHEFLRRKLERGI